MISIDLLLLVDSISRVIQIDEVEKPGSVIGLEREKFGGSVHRAPGGAEHGAPHDDTYVGVRDPCRGWVQRSEPC